jgi:hypothetical protein
MTGDAIMLMYHVAPSLERSYAIRTSWGTIIVREVGSFFNLNNPRHASLGSTPSCDCDPGLTTYNDIFIHTPPCHSEEKNLSDKVLLYK